MLLQSGSYIHTCIAWGSRLPLILAFSRSSTAFSSARRNHLNPFFSSFGHPQPCLRVRPHMSIPIPHPPFSLALFSKYLAESSNLLASWHCIPSCRYSCG